MILFRLIYKLHKFDSSKHFVIYSIDDVLLFSGSYSRFMSSSRFYFYYKSKYYEVYDSAYVIYLDYLVS